MKKSKSFSQIFREAAASLEFEVDSKKVQFTEEMLAVMEQEKISRSRLANLLQVAPARVTALLRGNNNFTLETMIRICRALGVEYSHHIQRPGCTTRWIDLPAEDVVETAKATAQVTATSDAVHFDEIREFRKQKHVSYTDAADYEELALAA